MTSTPEGKDLLIVQRVLYLHHFLQYSITQNLGFTSKLTTLSMESMFFFAYCLLHLQAVFKVSEKCHCGCRVELHKLVLLGMICTNGLMNSTGRITNIANTKFSVLSTYALWYLGCILYHLIFGSHFLMLTVNKLIAYCLVLYTFAYIYL